VARERTSLSFSLLICEMGTITAIPLNRVIKEAQIDYGFVQLM
jgi:hypothetical protein